MPPAPDEIDASKLSPAAEAPAIVGVDAPDPVAPVIVTEGPQPTNAGTESERRAAHHGVLSAVRVIAGVTLISRLGGLFRDGAMARILGSEGPVSSAFNFAFMIPNVFRRLFGEGALTAAFLPEYAALEGKDHVKADRFGSLVVVAVLGVTVAITLVAEAGLLLTLWLAPASPERQLMISLTALMLPYMPLVCIGAVMAGMLQTHHKFGLASAGPIILNTGIIAATVVAYLGFKLTRTQTAYVVSVAVLVSGFALVLAFAAALRRHVRWQMNFEGVRENAHRTLRRFVPAMIGLSALQLSSVLDGLVATYTIWSTKTTFLGFHYPLDQSTNGLLQFTQRLYQFPLGVFGIAVATAVFPALSRASDNTALFTDMLRRGLRLSLFISLPASVGLVLVGEDLARVLFRGGNFSEDGVRRSAAILTGYAVSVWAFSANQVLTRAFYAKGDTKTPVRVSLQCVVINLIGNMTLIWVPGIGEAAFGWSTAVSSLTQFLLLVRAARKMMTDGRLLDSSAMRGGGATLDFTLAMGFVVVLLLELMPGSLTLRSTALRLAACCGAGAATYFGLAHKFKAPELRWLTAREV